MLLESKGLSNCSSAKKRFDEVSLKAPVPFQSDNAKSKTKFDVSTLRINTDRSEGKNGIDRCFQQINTDRIDSNNYLEKSLHKLNTDRTESRNVTPRQNVRNFFDGTGSKLILSKKTTRPETERTVSSEKMDEIQEKCRVIKNKKYTTNQIVCGELNSLNKLRNKLVSPLNRKC